MRNIIFALALLCHTAGNAQTLDAAILKTINQHDRPAWDNMMQGLSFAVPIVAPVQVVSLWTYGIIKKDKKVILDGHRSAATIILAMGLSTALKYTVNRVRPYNEYPDDIVQRDFPETFSFPSGHTTSAFATATAMSLSCRKWYVTVPAYTYAGLVAYARMRLGVHYPTDVLAGMIIGTGSGLLVWHLDKIIFKRSKEKKIPDPVAE
jgi:membrane-associated phospholipid phosphatase